MFSNVLRKIDISLLKEQEEALTLLITEERIPLNHPLVGLLGLISALKLERVTGKNRIDISMNYWRSVNGELCINFHPSLYHLSTMKRLALCSGILLSTFSSLSGSLPMKIEDFMGMVEDIMGETTLIRFGDVITSQEEGIA